MIEVINNSRYSQSWILLRLFTVTIPDIKKRICKETISLVFLPQINQQVSGIGIKLITRESYFPPWWKCIFLWSVWSRPLSGTGYRPGQTLAVMQDGSSSAPLSNVSAQKNLGEINRSPQEMLSLQPNLSFILMKFMTASLFYKPASFPQNMMYFPNLIQP